MDRGNNIYKLSIIIVNYNSFSLLDNCLRSIQNQNFNFKYEVIIVDNASTEGDISDTIEKFQNIILIKNKTNLGFGKANNIGVKETKGEFILLLNNDTEFILNPINTLIDFLKEQNRPIICAPKLLFSDLSYQASAYKFPSIWRLFSSNFFLEKIFSKVNFFNKYYLGIEDKTEIQNVDSVIGAFMFMQRETFTNLNGFDEDFFFYHEDSDLCYRLKKSGGETIYFPGLSIIHIGGGTTNKIKWFQLKNKVIARYKFFHKHHSFLYFLFALILEVVGNSLRAFLFLIFGILTLNKNKLELSIYYFRALTLSRNSK